MSQTEKIHIYHTNDLHSHFDNWAKMVHFLKKRKELHKADRENMLLFDIGDHMDRFHPITEATHGKANVELMNSLHYDGAVIGNNEGITLPYESLDTLYEAANFPVILANLYDRNGKRPAWAIPYKIHEFESGIRVGVVGVSVFYQSLYGLLGWEMTDPVEELSKILPDLKRETDALVLLSHLGITDDEMIARTFPEIDCILGGHTHHLLDVGEFVGGTLLCGAGKYGEHIGHVTLEFEKGTRKILKKQAAVISTIDMQADEETEAELEALAAAGNEILKEPIAEASGDLVVDWYAPSPLAQFLAGALREWCKTDLSMVNSGMLLGSIPKGKVTRELLHRICPHPINPCVVKLTGEELKEVVLMAHTERMVHLKVKGLGFRGKVMGVMVYEGIEVEAADLPDGTSHVKNIKVLGEPLINEKVYQIATVDMFTFGSLFPEIRRAPHKQYFMPEFLRDLLAWKLSESAVSL